MDRSVFIAMGGARDAMASHSVQAHNLANANTGGFRADLTQAASAPVNGPGFPDRVYAQQHGQHIPDLTPGTVRSTGRKLDVAIQGQGFMLVQGPDGREALSRAGNLKIDSVGMLTNPHGQPVMGNSGPIALPPHQSLEIGADGTISILPAGQTEGPLAVVDRIMLVNPPPETLVKSDDGLIRTRDGQTPPPDAAVQLNAGALEGSNVQPVTALVKMIELQRQFEMHVKFIENAEENDRAASRLLRLR